MARRTLTQRLETVEQVIAELVTLPERVTGVENGLERVGLELSEFRATAEDRYAWIDHRFDTIDRRFEAIDQRFEAVDRRFDAIDREFVAVRAEIREGHDETRRYMRVLYEDLIERIKTMRE